MAHHKSAKKRIRQTVKRTLVNRRRTSRIRTYLRKVEEAIDSGNQDQAREAFKQAQPELMRGVNKNLVHRNTCSRKLSRLSARINSMNA